MASSRITTVLKLAVLCGLAVYLFRGVDLESVGRSLGRVPSRIFAAGLLLTLISLSLQAVRWRLLMHRPSISLKECQAFVGLGASMSLVSPSSVISDGAISYWMGKRNADVLGAMSTFFAARLIGSLSGAVLFLATLASHLWVFERLPLAWSPGKAAFAGAALLLVLAALLAARRHRKRLADLRRHALPALKHPGSLALALLLSVGVQVVQFTVYFLGFRAVGAPLALLDVFFFAPLIVFMTMLPISIGGIGVRETMAIFFYTLIPGVTKEMVLAQAGYNYLILFGAAAVNLAFAAVVLGLPWRARRKVPARVPTPPGARAA
ncbi:MAG TPA: lysylphosphatidylglycerol synthase transmembrane domain-containing protein [Fibrobacteria bacterium]|nr:lysylphosphatidylglycerol synthase transmembrane domain-containing protein [Fibrobacteria bacterium]